MVEPELKRELDEIRDMVKEDRHIVRAIHRDLLIEMFGKYILWIILIGGGAYIFFTYVRPYLATFTVGTVPGPAGPFGLPTSADFQKLIDSYKAGQ